MFRGAFRGSIIGAALLVCLAPMALGQQLMTTRIFGGSGGNGFTDSQPPAGARVAEVRIRCGEIVDSVQLIYALSDGRTSMAPMHGGSGGRENVYRLDADEYIIGLSGRYGESIDSLSIHTNKRTSQPYGGRGGDRDFQIEVPSGNQAVGFAGQAGDRLDAIGLTYVPLQAQRRQGFFSGALSPRPPARQPGSGGGGNYSGALSVSLPIAQTSIAGGGGGVEFSDRDIPQGARISGVRVRGAEVVDSIQVLYTLSDGSPVEGPRHGGTGGSETVFRLDDDEYIIGLSGRYGDHIDSLSILTNKRTSQRLGGRGGDREYRIEVPTRSQAVGFAGRAGDHLDAIGLTYATITSGVPRRGRRRPY
jgi:hypothetical protein